MTGHPRNGEVPRCTKCNQPGHYASKCPNGPCSRLCSCLKELFLERAQCQKCVYAQRKQQRRVGPRSRTITQNATDRQLATLKRSNDIMLRGVTRPQTRGECAGAMRPCPWAGCKWHLYLDVTSSGGLKINFPDKELEELEHTCALDLADDGGTTLEMVGKMMNLTRERVRQVEVQGLRLMKLRGVTP